MITPSRSGTGKKVLGEKEGIRQDWKEESYVDALKEDPADETDISRPPVIKAKRQPEMVDDLPAKPPAISSQATTAASCNLQEAP
jgi:hypothetical protein